VLLTDIDGDGYGDILALYTTSPPTRRTLFPPRRTGCTSGGGKGTHVFRAIHHATEPQLLSRRRGGHERRQAARHRAQRRYIVSILYNQTGRSFVSDFGTWQPLVLAARRTSWRAGINSLTLERCTRRHKRQTWWWPTEARRSPTPSCLAAHRRPRRNLPVNPDVITGGITVLLNSITRAATSGTLRGVGPSRGNIGQGFIITATLIPTAE